VSEQAQFLCHAEAGLAYVAGQWPVGREGFAHLFKTSPGFSKALKQEVFAFSVDSRPLRARGVIGVADLRRQSVSAQIIQTGGTHD
jgi:hypothetical protein